jgi:effector-binding domain-containing protein
MTGGSVKKLSIVLLLMVLHGGFILAAPKVLRYEINVRNIASQPVMSARTTVKTTELGETLGRLIPDVFGFLQRRGVSPLDGTFVRYHSFKDGNVDLEVGLPVSQTISGDGKIQPGELPGGIVATTLHTGSYERLPLAYQALREWITSHGYQSAGAPWEVYQGDPDDSASPDEWKTEVLWPIQPKSGLIPAR